MHEKVYYLAFFKAWNPLLTGTLFEAQTMRLSSGTSSQQSWHPCQAVLLFASQLHRMQDLNASECNVSS